MSQLEWEIPDTVSIFHGRQGTNKVFGRDVDDRKKFSDSEAKARFNEKWNEILKAAIESATRIDAARAKQRLPSHFIVFLKAEQEHREFKLNDCDYIAQIKCGPDGQTLTQLWFIPSADSNPKAIFVEFETVAAKQEFEALAKQFGWDDGRALARKLIADFTQNVKGRK